MPTISVQTKKPVNLDLWREGHGLMRKKLSALITLACEEADWSVEVFAEHAGLSWFTIYRYIRKEGRYPRHETIMRILKAVKKAVPGWQGVIRV